MACLGVLGEGGGGRGLVGCIKLYVVTTFKSTHWSEEISTGKGKLLVLIPESCSLFQDKFFPCDLELVCCQVKVTKKRYMYYHHIKHCQGKHSPSPSLKIMNA